VLEGFGEKSVQNLLQAIETSKTQPLHRLIYALGIRYVGETTAKTLAQQVTNLFDLKDYNMEQLQEMDDVGIKVAGSIHEFFQNHDNLRMLEKLEALGVKMYKEELSVTVGNLNGQTFLFTGTLTQLKRSEAEERVERNGGKILGGVSSKLNYLVVGEDAGSKLEKAKKIPAINIITEEDFLKMLPT
jgi:DNA ligase (NAD+)